MTRVSQKPVSTKVPKRGFTFWRKVIEAQGRLSLLKNPTVDSWWHYLLSAKPLGYYPFVTREYVTQNGQPPTALRCTTC